ncbi:MAG: methyltransferase domain-containing protein [Candidatus Acidiferrales bacterium]
MPDETNRPAAISQTWNPETYARNARFVAELGGPVVDLLAPRPGERILDLGCGDGALTAKIAALGCDVVGVDSSAPQIEAARKLGLDARVMSAEHLAFNNEFDAVFSNAALHWIKNPDAVISGAWRALRTPGRFVGEFGGHGNIAKIKKALVDVLARRGLDGEASNPWYYPTAEEYSERLERAGFRVRVIQLIPRPTPLPGDIAAWLETFAQNFTSLLPASDRPGFVAEVQEALRTQLCDTGGRWTADYVRLRFAAEKNAVP